MSVYPQLFASIRCAFPHWDSILIIYQRRIIGTNIGIILLLAAADACKRDVCTQTST